MMSEMLHTEKSTINAKVYALDLLRIIAIALVVLDHVSSWNNFYHQSDLKVYWFVQAIAKAGVPLFLMISGYFLLQPKQERILVYAKKRMHRILVPFVCWSYIYLLFQYKFPLENWQRSIAQDQITFNPLLILKQPTYGHLWFMYLLIGCYIAVPLLRKINAHLNHSEIIYITFILLTSLLHSFKLNATGNALIHSSIFINFFCDYMVFFEGGYLLRLLESKIRIRSEIYYILFFIGVLLTWGVIDKTEWGTDHATLLLGGTSPLMLMTTLGIWGIVYHFPASNHIIRKVTGASRYTFQLYFCHMIFLWLCTKVKIKNRNLFQICSNEFVTIVVVGTIVFICSLLTSIIIDKIRVWVIDWIYIHRHKSRKNI